MLVPFLEPEAAASEMSAANLMSISLPDSEPTSDALPLLMHTPYFTIVVSILFSIVPI